MPGLDIETKAYLNKYIIPQTILLKCSLLGLDIGTKVDIALI